MIKCKCSKCGEESVYEDHKAGWMAGWDFVGQSQFCGECSSSASEKTVNLPWVNKSSDDFVRKVLSNE